MDSPGCFRQKFRVLSLPQFISSCFYYGSRSNPQLRTTLFLRGDLDISGLLNFSSPFLVLVVSRTSNLPPPCTPCDRGAVGELASLRPSPFLGPDNLQRPTAQVGKGSPPTRPAALCCSSSACATPLASWELALKARHVSLTALGPVSPPSLVKNLGLGAATLPLHNTPAHIGHFLLSLRHATRDQASLPRLPPLEVRNSMISSSSVCLF